MKKIITYRKSNGNVEMLSDGVNQLDDSIFGQKEMDLTDEQLNEIYNGKRTFYKNGKIITEPRIEKQEVKFKIKQELEQAVNISEIKEVLKKIIEL